MKTTKFSLHQGFPKLYIFHLVKAAKKLNGTFMMEVRVQMRSLLLIQIALEDGEYLLALSFQLALH